MKTVLCCYFNNPALFFDGMGIKTLEKLYKKIYVFNSGENNNPSYYYIVEVLFFIIAHVLPFC